MNQEAPVIRGKKNIFYQSPNITSNEVFYQDYKGQLKPNSSLAYQSQTPLNQTSLQSNNENFNLRSRSFHEMIVENQQKQKYGGLVMEVRNQFLLNDKNSRDGSRNQQQSYGKKVSLNMKNYSSISIGENDDIRRVYERSASQQSANSCNTPRLAGTAINFLQKDDSQLNFVVSQQLQQQQNSMYTSPSKLFQRLQQSQDNYLVNQSIKTKHAEKSLENPQILMLGQKLPRDEEQAITKEAMNGKNKIKWPSNSNNQGSVLRSFNKHAKMIPQSKPTKTLMESVFNHQLAEVQKPQPNPFYEQK